MSLLDSMQVRVEGASANGLYSQALVVGNMVFLSGVTGTDPATGKLVEGTVGDRTVRTCVAVKELPRLTDIEIEVTAIQ
ncbi:hypothetical protein Neosp_013583 [[Neocosmospora] mangrovei]